MKSSRAVLTAAVLIIVALAGWWVFHRRGAERVDLIPLFDQAAKQPAAGFQVVDATLAGDTKQAIAAPPNGRITFHVRVPDDGWLRCSLGLKPEAWDKEGDGVYFFAGVSDGKSFEQLFTQTVNPFGSPSERKWIPVSVDLGAYAGEEIDVILNTRASGPGKPPDDRNDLPLWGAPTISR